MLLAHLFVTFPYMLGAVKPLLDELEVTYEEAAYTLGAGKWQTFRYVILPALRGGLFSGTLLTFAHSLGEFGATVMVSGNLRLRTQTAPLYIFAQFEAGHVAEANAVAAVLAALSFVIFFFLLRYAGNAEALMSIRLDKLTKSFGGQPVVKPTSLEVSDGELFVLLGASGSGKSTILRMVAGLTLPTRGPSGCATATSPTCRRRTAGSASCSRTTRSSAT